jgi:hypothetical protein
MNRTAVLTLVLFAVSALTTTFAGPAPGTYTGTFARISPAAKPKLDSYTGTATASNPADSNATASTQIILSAVKNASDSVRCKIVLLPSGDLDVDVSGKVRSRTTGRLIRFKASGIGKATIGATSIGASIRNGELRGNVPAAIEISARSEATNLFVTISVRPSERHPLGSYSATFGGSLPAM